MDAHMDAEIRYVRLFHPGAKGPKTLFLMTAGQSEFEASRDSSKYTSERYIDSSLSPDGIEAANRLAKRCKFMHVAAEAKAVVSSPLTRAVQTASMALGSHNVVKRDYSFSDGFFGRNTAQTESGNGGISTRYFICRHFAEVANNVSSCGRDIDEVTRSGEPSIAASQWDISNLDDNWCDPAAGSSDGLFPVIDFTKNRVVVTESIDQAMKRAAKAWEYIFNIPEQRVAILSHPGLLSLFLAATHFVKDSGSTSQVKNATTGSFRPPHPCDVLVVHVTAPIVHCALVSQERQLPWFTPNSVDRVDAGEPFLEDDEAEAAARQHGGDVVPGDEEPITCCFIVLGHCLQQDGSPSTTHRRRIKAAARAFKEYALSFDHARPCIIVTGANSTSKNFSNPNREWNEKDSKRSEAEAAREILEEFYKIPKRYVLVEDFSANTAEAAVNCIPVLRSVGFPADIRIVTSEYHMPRAMASFHQVFSMEPAYAYEAICGMAQKAAATITPVVARNGCAEDVQEVTDKQKGSKETRARRAEHHAPKLRVRLARELTIVNNIRSHSPSVFHMNRLIPEPEKLWAERSTAALLSMQLASGSLPSSSKQFITAPPPPKSVTPTKRTTKDSRRVSSKRHDHQRSTSGRKAPSSAEAEAAPGEVDFTEIRVQHNFLRKAIDASALSAQAYEDYLRGRELVVICSQQTTFDVAQKQYAKRGGVAPVTARRFLDAPLSVDGRARAGGDLRRIVRSHFHRQNFKAVDKVVSGSNMASMQTTARVFGSTRIVLPVAVCPLLDARVDGFATLSRPLRDVVKEDEKVASCRWKYSQNGCSAALNEWNHEQNRDSHVLLVIRTGNRSASDATDLAGYTAAQDDDDMNDSALFAAALNAQRGRRTTAFWTMASTDMKRDSSVQPYEDRASFAMRLRQIWPWLLEEMRRYPENQRLAIVAHPSWVQAFVSTCQGEPSTLSSVVEDDVSKQVYCIKFR